MTHERASLIYQSSLLTLPCLFRFEVELAVLQVRIQIGHRLFRIPRKVDCSEGDTKQSGKLDGGFKRGTLAIFFHFPVPKRHSAGFANC